MVAAPPAKMSGPTTRLPSFITPTTTTAVEPPPLVIAALVVMVTGALILSVVRTMRPVCTIRGGLATAALTGLVTGAAP